MNFFNYFCFSSLGRKVRQITPYITTFFDNISYVQRNLTLYLMLNQVAFEINCCLIEYY